MTVAHPVPGIENCSFDFATDAVEITYLMRAVRLGNAGDSHARMKSMRYRHQPIRRVHMTSSASRTTGGDADRVDGCRA
ncbi:hypothetical protein WME99_44315 [Sorangium sp. So ce136]|uniref:hypothetical protein n=1 Tax=Sorangium sp. So ce136 TaxID=3133284 RepID=UPI003F01CFE2